MVLSRALGSTTSKQQLQRARWSGERARERRAKESKPPKERPKRVKEGFQLQAAQTGRVARKRGEGRSGTKQKTHERREKKREKM